MTHVADEGGGPPQVAKLAGTATPDREVFLRLAELSQEVFANRRTAEWRLNFSFWAAIGLIDYFVLTSEPGSIPSPSAGWVWTAFVFLLVLYFVFQIVIHRENRTTSAFRFYYMDCAEGIKRERPSTQPPWSSFATNDWFYILMPFTAVLLVVSGWLVASKLR